ncbi:MAG: hypothetical protein RM049_15890 [Nostoc sp. DedQUE04]|uniref:P-loop ATPase, Sll1717 family n=1 Tax=Nostoc sp. DedQUE04 TaxID=3075390 RepID=UPI002AD29753|nr:hypothetical protein [Nostoc sp. DedQUE04]MDZ8136767.1 hypothetical protein [Nostoc sp. DedQUE04]
MKLDFTESTIQGLFGHEAAEDEDPKRLKEYYFKGTSYKQVNADQAVRILVGHKGIGKSALFKVAIAEDEEQNNLSVLVQPNDIGDLTIDQKDFLSRVRSWTSGLSRVIVQKSLNLIGIRGKSLKNAMADFEDYDLKIGDFIFDYFQEVISNNGYDTSKKEFIKKFLETRKISVYIDDLDRGWQGKGEDIIQISSLLNSVTDISRDSRGVSFKVSLRADVYYLVRTSDESTDKIEGSVIWQSWTNHEILVLLIKRMETFLGRKINEEVLLKTSQIDLANQYFSNIMELRFTGVGKWHNAPIHRVLMSLIRKRPRDLVKLCTLAARKAYERKSSLIQTVDFKSVFEEYSQGRIQDTINEYRSELPDIDKLLMNMKPTQKERTTQQSYVYKTDELLKKIQSISQNHVLRFANSRTAVANPKELAAFLYKINFLTARRETEDGQIVRKYFEENRYLSSTFVDFGFNWEIHPAYRWVLQPSDLDSIFRILDLSSDD